MSPICGSAAMDDDRAHAQFLHQYYILGEAPAARSSDMAWPPYFTTHTNARAARSIPTLQRSRPSTSRGSLRPVIPTPTVGVLLIAAARASPPPKVFACYRLRGGTSAVAADRIILLGGWRVAALAIRQLSCSYFARHSTKASEIARGR